MRKASPLLYPPSRSGDEWLVGEEEKDALLKAKVEVDRNQPACSGWKCFNTGEYKEDASLICSNQRESPCCILTVSLSGEARNIPSNCEGKYESTGLISMGREVNRKFK